MNTALVEIAEAARTFLLVGGHAVILWGVPRFTRDIDLLITDAHRSAWYDLISSLGYKRFHKVDAFEQFEAAGKPGLDLMLVDSSTWEKLHPAATQVELDQGASASIPGVLHLIAMKLHASKNPKRRADATDLQDVIALIKRHPIDQRDTAFTEILERHASPQDKAAIQRILGGHE